MKRTIKNIMIIAGIGIISGATIISCNQRSRSNDSNTAGQETEETFEDIKTNIRANYEEAKTKLEDVFQEDPEFVTKLDVKLDEFNQSLENLEGEMKEEGKEFNEDVKANIAHIKTEAQILEEKIESWGEATAEDMETLRNEIAEDFNRLVATLDSTQI